MGNVGKLYLFWFLREFFIVGAVTVPFFTQWAGMSYAQIFTLQAIFYLVIAAAQVPTGAFADKYGRKTSLLAGSALSVLGILIYCSVPNFWVFVLGEITVGLAFSFIGGADMALAFESAKKEGKKTDGVFTNSQIILYVATMLSAPVGSTLAYALSGMGAESFRLVFAISALPIFAAGLVALTLEEKRGKAKYRHGIVKVSREGIAAVLKNNYLAALVADRALVGASAFFMFWFYQSLLAEHGVSVFWNGPVSSAFNLVSICLLAFFGFGLHRRIKEVEGHFGTRNILFGSALAVGLLYLLAAFSQNAWLALPAMLLIPAMRAVREPVLLDLINGESGNRRRATINSAADMATGALMVVLYPLIGMLADASLQLALAVLGCIALASAAAASALYQKHAPKEHFFKP
jgi:MFS family permease